MSVLRDERAQRPCHVETVSTQRIGEWAVRDPDALCGGGAVACAVAVGAGHDPTGLDADGCFGGVADNATRLARLPKSSPACRPRTRSPAICRSGRSMDRSPTHHTDRFATITRLPGDCRNAARAMRSVSGRRTTCARLPDVEAETFGGSQAALPYDRPHPRGCVEQNHAIYAGASSHPGQ
jgi:hypothetical protein